jgi:hypothetical protein
VLLTWPCQGEQFRRAEEGIVVAASQELTRPAAAVRTGRRPVVVALCVVSAALMVWSGVIHLHLWQTAYRNITIGHLNTLFLIQSIAAIVVGVALVAFRHFLVALAGLALMAGTLTGYLIARYRTGGLFGFRLTVNTSDGNRALMVEIAAIVLLAITAWLLAGGMSWLDRRAGKAR